MPARPGRKSLIHLEKVGERVRGVVHVGPGLGVRILGDVTEGDKLEVLRQVDEIFISTIQDFGIYDEIWQAFAVFLPVKCVSESAAVEDRMHAISP